MDSSNKELSSEQEKADQQLQDRVDEADDPELEELLNCKLVSANVTQFTLPVF